MLKQVKTNYGSVEGTLSESGYALFKGIPYAAPPIGVLRWKYAQPPMAWDGIRQCNKWGAACIQSATMTPDTFYGKEFYASGDYPPEMSEDCLFLNVWTPAEHGSDKLPVMVWIHGGGVQTGYSHEIEFDGDAICKRGCILVTINYRVNIFGYFAHPELTAETGASGNYGVSDQIQALRWIRENIAQFGGDSGNIMVFGQSGGGRSTQALCCSPLAKGLIHHAAVHSAGGTLTGFGRLPRAAMEERGVRFVETAGVKTIASLREMPVGELFAAFQAYFAKAGMHGGFNICTDGYILPLSMEDSLLQGVQHDIDYILGNTVDEGISGRRPAMPGMVNMTASLRGWGRLQNEQGKNPPYMYVFDRAMPGDDAGAFHSSELWYVFGTLGRCWRPFAQGDYRLSQQMLDYWTNFAKTGNPNGAGLPLWKPFAEDKLEMRLGLCADEQDADCHMEDYSMGGKMKELEDELLAK